MTTSYWATLTFVNFMLAAGMAAADVWWVFAWTYGMGCFCLVMTIRSYRRENGQ